MTDGIHSDENFARFPHYTNSNDGMNSRSHSAQEIISRKPDFTERWALILFLGILLFLLASTWFIRYPDVIEATAVLSAHNAPREIIPLQEGRLVKLFFKNDEHVQQGQQLAWLESTASHLEIIDLSNQLDSSVRLLAKQKPDRVSQLFHHHYKQLGELQTAYQQFIAAWQQFNDYITNGFYGRKKQMLRDDIVALHKMNATVHQQRELTKQNILLSEESFKMNEYLYQEKVISKEEYRNEKSKLLSKQAALPQLAASALSNENLRRDKQKEMHQLDHDIAQQRLSFEQSLGLLKSAVDDWLKRHVLYAPNTGNVTFLTRLQENRFIQKGKLLGYVVPDDASYYAEVILPQNNLGKVSLGQQVQLRFTAYPYQEFGYITSNLDYISKVPSDSGFLATVRIDNGLTTTQGRKLQYKNGLKAQAIVITRKTRLLQRIYHSVVKLTSK